MNFGELFGGVGYFFWVCDVDFEWWFFGFEILFCELFFYGYVCFVDCVVGVFVNCDGCGFVGE